MLPAAILVAGDSGMFRLRGVRGMRAAQRDTRVVSALVTKVLPVTTDLLDRVEEAREQLSQMFGPHPLSPGGWQLLPTHSQTLYVTARSCGEGERSPARLPSERIDSRGSRRADRTR